MTWSQVSLSFFSDSEEESRLFACFFALLALRCFFADFLCFFDLDLRRWRSELLPLELSDELVWLDELSDELESSELV